MNTKEIVNRKLTTKVVHKTSMCMASGVMRFLLFLLYKTVLIVETGICYYIILLD